MRGLPGSGKSTLARELAGEKGVIHSTDDYFYKNGMYEFDSSLLGINHGLNYTAFCRSLDKGISPVICDNTNVQYWEYENYVNAALNAGYRWAFVVMPHPQPDIAEMRSHHKVPKMIIEQMLTRWEP